MRLCVSKLKNDLSFDDAKVGIIPYLIFGFVSSYDIRMIPRKQTRFLVSCS